MIWITWLQFPDKTYLLSTHTSFPEYNKKYLEGGKESMKWGFVGAIYPPEHYGLKPLDIKESL